MRCFIVPLCTCLTKFQGTLLFVSSFAKYDASLFPFVRAYQIPRGTSLGVFMCIMSCVVVSLVGTYVPLGHDKVQRNSWDFQTFTKARTNTTVTNKSLNISAFLARRDMWFGIGDFFSSHPNYHKHFETLPPPL